MSAPIRHIAEAAGVPTAAVSRALENRRSLSGRTRQLP